MVKVERIIIITPAKIRIQINSAIFKSKKKKEKYKKISKNKTPNVATYNVIANQMKV